jgi:hypothetical protein
VPDIALRCRRCSGSYFTSKPIRIRQRRNWSRLLYGLPCTCWAGLALLSTRILPRRACWRQKRAAPLPFPWRT